MRRLGLAIVGLALCVVTAACTSATSPDQEHGEWMADGTWCSGYVTIGGECVEDGGN
jgi:hypothetical protein